MGKFRYKSPTVVEAYQWFKNGDHPDDKVVDGSEGKVVARFTLLGPEEPVCNDCGALNSVHGYIYTDRTDKSGYRVCPGDYVVTTSTMPVTFNHLPPGDYYPCKFDEWLETFEEITGIDPADYVAL